ncbi:riboflavin biosynthesis protein RibF [Tautonia plasticadhaerens]|uniref:Riboflavin biosynthesis protein n=1 Tax=Tautonia plasticadhaerens TaxID=2527974 RepID=A0A518GY02_9BACT|nr:riboflavin biosynthesis protein RibF [Tautonia plasticadhaerens]QDV33422.1 Riboflavin kinase [Tautonia plasticadhaerens]
MITLDSLAQVPEPLRRGVLSIGNFDGVHLGHAELIRHLRRLAGTLGVPAIALTFDPHPIAVLRPEQAPAPLTWSTRKAELLGGLGVDEVGVFRSGPWLLGLTAREFFDRVVLGQFDAIGLVEGPTFGFGRDRVGTVETLDDWCDDAGLRFQIAGPSERDGRIVSSTRIRHALLDGSAEEAASLLGRPHRLRGTVERGEGRGRTIGFPTANLGGIDTLIPADGVYATIAYLEDAPGPVPSATHIGPNATFGAEARTVEVHLLDFEADLYGRRMEVDLLARLRPTLKFDGLAPLLSRMERDVAAARAVIARHLLAT